MPRQPESVNTEMSRLTISAGSSDKEEPKFHPLRTEWTMWYLDDHKQKNWMERLHEVHTFDTIEVFWSLMNAVPAPSRLNHACDYNVFRNKIQPVWEEPENKDGGRWLIETDQRMEADQINLIWTEILMAMIGEQFGQDSDNICGIVCNVRNKGSKISVWTSDADDRDANTRIGHVLKEKLMDLELPDGRRPVFSALRYEVHEDVQQKTSSLAPIRSTLVIRNSH
uniref:EIF-4F 25 kDa subunit n=1 Tax=Steinernema glaseri TaxID=37863 RepID=A0A1I8ASD3_9BILA